MDDVNDLRHIMDFVGSTEDDDSYDEILLIFIENSLFLAAQSHSWHLQAKMYSKHMELDELYKELPEYVDSFVEGLMNSRGALPVGTGHQYTFGSIEGCIPVLEEYVQQAKAIHEMLDAQEDYGSVNSIEDIISFIERSLYKLKVLQ